MITFNIRHTTTFTYSTPVLDSRNIIKIFPRKSSTQKTISHQLIISGNPEVMVDKDIFGNKFGMFRIEHSHNELVVDSLLSIVNHPKDIISEVEKCKYSWSDLDHLLLDNSFSLFLSSKNGIVIPELISLVQSLNLRQLDPFEAILLLNEYIYKNFTYRPFSTTISTSLEEIWRTKTGVCQDFSHILIAILRLVHIPSRYVSGYICPNCNGMRGDGASHAWVEAYLPSYGWIGIDPTNNCVVAEKHVRLAVGRDYHDVSPVKGKYRGKTFQKMNAIVTVSYNPNESPIPNVS